MTVFIKSKLIAILNIIPFAWTIVDILRRNVRAIQIVFRRYASINDLLYDLDTELGKQIPLLVEQNRRMFREVQELKTEIEQLKKIVSST